MAGNTRKISTLMASEHNTIIYGTIASDGTEETNLVVYDSSANAATVGIADPLTCTIISIQACSNSATGVIQFNWDATTPVVALVMPYGGSSPLNQNYHLMGGLKNQGGSGRTGDITMTTTGLASGDSIHFILQVRMN